MNIKHKIALYRFSNKKIDKEIDSEYIRFYRSHINGDIFIFMLKLGWRTEGQFVEQVVDEVIDPITDTLMYRFRDKKYINVDPKKDYSGNLEFSSLISDDGYQVVPIEEVLPDVQLPDKLKVSDIYSLYDLINQNKKSSGSTFKRR